MGAKIEGKVAAVIDDTTLVLNIGSEQGVVKGTVFTIFATHGQIVDPDSGEALGLWEMAKAEVVATHVQPRLCTVRAPIVGDGAMGSDARPLSTLMVEHSISSAKEEDQWQRLDVRGVDISGRPKNQPIAVGDGARSLVDLDKESSPERDSLSAGESGEASGALSAGESREAGDAPPV